MPRWFQFSLGLLLLLNLLAAAFSAGYLMATRHAQESIQTAQEKAEVQRIELALAYLLRQSKSEPPLSTPEIVFPLTTDTTYRQ